MGTIVNQTFKVEELFLLCQFIPPFLLPLKCKTIFNGTLFVLLPVQLDAMDLRQFKTMSEEKQHRNLLLNGSCVADRKTGNTHVLLFQLHGFYVEVFFNEDGDEVIRTRSFEDTDQLQPYLEQIDIQDL